MAPSRRDPAPGSHDPFSGGLHGRAEHKTQQLCEQVSDALAFAFGDAGDEVLQDLLVAAVTPLPDASHVLVAVTSLAEHAPAEILRALDHARGYLRDAVAQAVARRKVPRLSFTVAPRGPGHG